MRLSILAAPVAALLLSGCGLFVSDEQRAFARDAAQDRVLAEDLGPSWVPEERPMGGGVAYDPWEMESSTVVGVIDDDLDLHDGIVD